MTLAPIEAYRKQIERELKQGDATEHTHRPALKTLLESFATGITATNEPKRIACGAPATLRSFTALMRPVDGMCGPRQKSRNFPVR